MGEVDSVPSFVWPEPRTIAQILPTLMGNKCALDDDSVRAAIERESSKIEARMAKMALSQEVLSKALEKGLLRRPGT